MTQERAGDVKKATIYSIAKELGVHASTVSRAFSRPEMVRPALRERIMAKAAELRFEPNPVARGLVTGRTGTVGLLIPDIQNPYFVPVMREVQRAANRAGIRTLLMDSQLQGDAERDLVAEARGYVDGLILVSPRCDVSQLVTDAGSKPVVLVNRKLPGYSSIEVTMTEALHKAGEHLASLGHRRVALLRGPDASWVSGQRANAIKDWASQAGVEVHEVGPVEALFEGGSRFAADVKATGATAVFCFDDLAACGLIAGLTKLGVSVPREMSIVGADDVLLASVVTPQLTTIRVPYDEVGTQAINLLKALSSGQAAEHVTLQGELVIRESTVPPRG